MKALVCGSRHWTDVVYLNAALDLMHSKYGFSVLIEGEQRGVDLMARAWAEMRGLKVEPYEADWDRYGRAAGPIRNRRMLDEGRPDLVIAFPGGVGTTHMVRHAERAGVEICRLRPPPAAKG